jgi:hypothetical protein
MESLTASPDTSASPAADAAQALFMEARRRRRRRWLAGGAAVLVVVAVVAVCGAIWLPGAFDQSARRTGAVGGLAGQSSAPSGRAKIAYRVVTAGVLEAHGTWDIRFSGNNRSLSFSRAVLARGPEPAQSESATERIVDGQMYALFRVHGHPQWIHEPAQPYINVKIIDPHKLLRVLEPFARFQGFGYQVLGGVRLKLLRATDPHNLTRHTLLPVMWTSGQAVSSLEIWVDRYGVVHRMAFTFRAPARIMLSTPVSKAALATYKRAERALEQVPLRRHNLAMRHLNQALRHAFPIRQGYEVTKTTVTFTAIGQPQHITAPQHALSAR